MYMYVYIYIYIYRHTHDYGLDIVDRLLTSSARVPLTKRCLATKEHLLKKFSMLQHLRKNLVTNHI